MTERFLNERIELHCGDCLAVLPTLTENSIDSCACDPPYHLTSIAARARAQAAADTGGLQGGRHRHAWLSEAPRRKLGHGARLSLIRSRSNDDGRGNQRVSAVIGEQRD
jgi:hypothetical protein